MNPLTPRRRNDVKQRLAKIVMTSIALVSLAGGTAQGALIADNNDKDFDLGSDTTVNSDHVYTLCTSAQTATCAFGAFQVTGTRVLLNPWNLNITTPMTITMSVFTSQVGVPVAGFQNIPCNFQGPASSSGIPGFGEGQPNAVHFTCSLPSPLSFALAYPYSFKHSARTYGNGTESDTGSGKYYLEGSYASESGSGVPEPASVCLVGGAFAGLAFLRRGRMTA